MDLSFSALAYMGPVDCDPASIHQPVPSILLIGHPLKYHRCQRMPYPGSLVPPRQVSDVGPTGTPVICSFGNCDGRPCPLKHHGEPLVAFLSSASILDSGLTKATQGPPRLFFPHHPGTSLSYCSCRVGHVHCHAKSVTQHQF